MWTAILKTSWNSIFPEIKLLVQSIYNSEQTTVNFFFFFNKRVWLVTKHIRYTLYKTTIKTLLIELISI